MTVFYILVIVAAWLIILTTFAVRGRKGHPGLKALQGWCYAHRGLHGNGVPENSMAASGPHWTTAMALSWTSTC